ncbi:MAG: hypothetical protein NG737_01375 [Omnitrophica bacterium]|nr:hypothetical protein [Candidatus Omnitrophota bacterium]
MSWIFLVIVLVMVVIFSFSFSKGKAPLRYLFYFWLICFHIGPRAIRYQGIPIFFVEGITWLLFFLYLFRENFYFGYKKLFPRHTGVLFLICALGIFMAIGSRIETTVIVTQVKVFLCLFPCFYITYIGFKFLDIKINTIILIFTIGAFILAVVGVGSYFFPSIINLFPTGLTSGESVLIGTRQISVRVGEKIFLRGGGSMWASLIIAGYFGLLLFPIYIKGLLSRGKIKKICYFGICILMLINIMINGHRSVYMGLLLGIAGYSKLKGFKGIFRGAIFLLIISMVIPEEVYLRFLSSSDPEAWAGRVGRFNFAWRSISANPMFGGGWGYSGWVHNFILQLGADLGIIGLFVILLWLTKLFTSSLYIYKKNVCGEPLRSYLLSFLIGWLIFMGPMLAESAITWPFMMIPFWFFCAVLHNFHNGNIGEDLL